MMPSAEPRVRAWWPKTILARVALDARSASLAQAIGPQLTSEIEQRARMDWVSVSLLADLCERLLRATGPDGFLALMTQPDPDPSTNRSAQSALTVMGAEQGPFALLKHTARMWPEIASGMGSIEVSNESVRDAVLTFSGLPDPCLSTWFELCCRAMGQRALHTAHTSGSCTALSERKARKIVVKVRW